MGDASSECPSDAVHLTIVTLSGKEVASLYLQRGVSVEEVREHLKRLRGYPLAAQKLLNGGAVLGKECLPQSSPASLLLTLVLLPFDVTDAFFQVARDGHEAAIRSLLGKDAFDSGDCCALLAVTSWDGCTALHQAVIHGHEAACRALLQSASTSQERATMLRRRTGSGLCDHTALQLAASHGHCSICRTLLELAPTAEDRGGMLLATTSRPRGGGFGRDPGWTALHLAVSHKHTAVCSTLLLAAGSGGGGGGGGAERLLGDVLAARSRAGRTALHLAAEVWQPGVIALLDAAASAEELGAVVSAQDDLGDLPVHLAARRGRREAVRAIAASRPEALLLRNSAGQQALHIAAGVGKEVTCEVLELLRAAYSEEWYSFVAVQDKNGDTPLHHAARMGDSAVVEELLSCDPGAAAGGRRGRAPLEVVNEAGRTPVHVAAGRGRGAALAALLRRVKGRAALEARDISGETPLHLAARGGRRDFEQQEAVRLLVSHMTEWSTVVAVNDEGKTALHLAAEFCEDAVRVFFALTALKEQIPERVRMLMLKDGRGDTPLHGAVYRGHAAVARLIRDGTRQLPGEVVMELLTVRNLAGSTPLHVAAATGEDNGELLVQMLLEDRSAEEKGTLLIAQDLQGDTPLHVAARHGTVARFAGLSAGAQDAAREACAVENLASWTPAEVASDDLTRIQLHLLAEAKPTPTAAAAAAAGAAAAAAAAMGGGAAAAARQRRRRRHRGRRRR